jgi:hypothetical protein
VKQWRKTLADRSRVRREHEFRCHACGCADDAKLRRYPKRDDRFAWDVRCLACHATWVHRETSVAAEAGVPVPARRGAKKRRR